MDATTSPEWPLRLMRGTTGTVHAGQQYSAEVLDFSAPTVAERHTGTFETRTRKACGSDANTLRAFGGTATTSAEVTCKKCLRALAG